MQIALIGSYKFQIDFIKMYKQINILKTHGTLFRKKVQ